MQYNIMSLKLTFKVGKILSGVSLELYARLNEERVVVHHSLKVILLEGILNVVATVVHTARTNVTTCAFQLVRTLLHLCPVLVIQSFCYLRNAGCQRHDFKSL